MKHEHSLLLVALVVAVLTVNLCHGYAIKEPGAYTASFSKSSASAAAYSHSSSSSYTFGGDLNPTEVEGLQDALKAQAVAHANAGAVAGSDASSGAVAVATAHAEAGATSSNAITGAVASSSGAESSVNAANGIEGGKSSGCSGATFCNTATDSNAITGSEVDGGSYKKIASDKYTTNYSSGSQTNYAVSGQYVQPQPNSVVTGCITCKGPFPGPSGSIHDFKPAATHTVNTASGGSWATSSGSAVQPVPIPSGQSTHQQLPGPIGSIYDNKPVSVQPVPSGQYDNQYISTGSGQSTYQQQASTTGHISPSLIATLPGPSGSIFDSKPASAGASATATAVAGASATSNTQEYHAPASPSSCSGSGCGSTYQATPGLLNIIPVLPGPSGSIYDSKPAVGGGQNSAVSGSSSTSVTSTHSNVQPVVVPVVPTYSGAGSVTNIPASHPVVGPICNYAPGSGQKCGTPVQQIGQVDTESGSSTSSQNESAYSSTGSVTNIPASHPVVGPVCSYTPGSGQKCGTQTAQTAEVNTESGSSTFSQNESGHVAAGSVTNVPATHPVVEPLCSYAPGSGQKCGSPVLEISQTHQESGAIASNQQETGTVVVAPSIHPEIPEPATYYINKPAQPSKDIEAPLSSSTSFSGQIPCTDSNCGQIQNVASGCGSGTNCGGSAASAGSYATAQSSGVVYKNDDSSLKHSDINHDQAHLSGGIVFQNDDRSYSKNPTVSKPTYKNSETGGYAISSDPKQNTGILIGPGTGHLPIEADKNKPFGTQGAFAGSSASAFEKSDKLSGNQGTHDSSSTFSSATSQATEHTNTEDGTQVIIEKVDGTEVTPITNQYPGKTSCISGNCGSNSNVAIAGSNSNIGTPIKLPCYGKSCGGANTQIYIIEEKEVPYPQSQYGHNQGHGYHYGGSGVNSGYATGQVFIDGQFQPYDVTNQNGIKGSNYAGNYGGQYPSIPLIPHSGHTYGCRSGKCGNQGQFPVQFFGAPKFGQSALSGAYSSSKAYGGASAGSFASASAGATASAGSYARSY